MPLKSEQTPKRQQAIQAEKTKQKALTEERGNEWEQAARYVFVFDMRLSPPPPTFITRFLTHYLSDGCALAPPLPRFFRHHILFDRCFLRFLTRPEHSSEQ